MAELPPHLAAMARFTLETGLRRHNVTHLRWEQVDLERRLVWIPGEKTKNGKPLGVPLSATATQVLMQQQGNHREYVFIYREGPVYQTSTRAFKAAAKRVGLPADFRWHDLRHLWASWLAQDGTPILALQELGGWQSESMVRRYAHFSVEHLRTYIDRPVKVEGNAQAAGPSPPAGKSDPPVDQSTEPLGGAQKVYRPKFQLVKGGLSS